MKLGTLSWEDTRDHIKDRTNAVKDLTAPCGAMRYTPDGLELDGYGILAPTDYALGQLREYVDIPKAYFDRLKSSNPELLCENMNHWLGKTPEKRRLLRLIDGNNLRGFLSDRYRKLDNFDLVEKAIVPAVDSMDHDLDVASCQLTDKKFYLKLLSPRITMEVTKGDVVQAGIVIENSEIGCGNVKISPLVYRLVCTNGAIANDFALKQMHVGRSSKREESGAYEFYRDETLAADDRAFWMKVRDTIAGAFDQINFSKIVGKMTAATEDLIVAPPMEVIDVTAKRYNFSEPEKIAVLGHFLHDRDMSRYGLLNAVTRASQDLDDYERATEFERIGGHMLDMSRADWREIAH